MKNNLGKYLSALVAVAIVAAAIWALRSGRIQAVADDGSEPVRLVSVGGAATEIVFALGAGGDVVGVDMSSVYPAEARSLPQVGYVRTVSAEGILALEPTQIIAGHEMGPANAVAQVKATQIPLVMLSKIDTAEDLYQSIRSVAQALGKQSEGEALVAEIGSKFAAVEAPKVEPKVVFLMNTPGSARLNAAGTGTRAEDLIRLAGGRNAVTTYNGYKALSQEALMALEPDVVIIAAAETSGDVASSESVIAELKKDAAWAGLKALNEGRVYSVGLGEALSFGPRMGDAVLKMNRIFREAADSLAQQ